LRLCALRAVAVWVVWTSAGAALALIVDPARPITHQVEVQIIETALSDGTSPATIFGNSTQRAGIESAIDQIWAQAGIDVAFLPTVLRYNNTFAYQGNGGTRPTSDLGAIISGATAAGRVNVDPSVINMFFVNVVPGFGFTSENTANGIANIGNDGIAQFVGDNLLTWSAGRDVIASVVSHEIGHNLGLKHTASGLPNLMSPNSSSSQLSAQQIAAVFQTTGRNDSVAFIPHGGTGLLQPIPPSLVGDFNADGIVNHVDIDRLAWAAHNEPQSSAYDLNHDGRVTFSASQAGTIASDSDVLIRQVLMTEYGDIDLDGEVFLGDLDIFSTNWRKSGQFGWATGNIDGSREAGTVTDPQIFLGDLDLFSTFWRFGTNRASAAAIASIPEPSAGLLFLSAMLVGISARSRRT
jgi:hypothetical protein